MRLWQGQAPPDEALVLKGNQRAISRRGTCSRYSALASKLFRDERQTGLTQLMTLWGRDSECLDIASAILSIVPENQTEPRQYFLPLPFP